ncbi:MAG TPA: hypothetical protein VFA81_03705 [Burkholderiales bacterium]|nr:hypothetical protein [Burkholderiales bacterium]
MLLLIHVVGMLSSMVLLGKRPAVRQYGAMILVLGTIATLIIPPGHARPNSATPDGRSSEHPDLIHSL